MASEKTEARGSAAVASVTQPRPAWKSCVHKYLTLPFLAATLVLTVVWLFASARRDPTIYESLQTIQSGRPRARWRAAAALASSLSDPSKIPHDAEFSETLLATFGNRSLQSIDQRIHLYLAMAMGRVGDPSFYEPLVSALDSAKPGSDEQAVYVRALGLLSDPRAVPKLLPLLQADATTVRHATVQALGCIGAPIAREGLLTMLTDIEANIQWDAAVALAKMGDAAGKPILLQLLDRSYYKQFPKVRSEGCDWAMETALRTAANLNDPELNNRIKELSESDPSLRVRGVALEIMDIIEVEG